MPSVYQQDSWQALLDFFLEAQGFPLLEQCKLSKQGRMCNSRWRQLLGLEVNQDSIGDHDILGFDLLGGGNDKILKNLEFYSS